RWGAGSERASRPLGPPVGGGPGWVPLPEGPRPKGGGAPHPRAGEAALGPPSPPAPGGQGAGERPGERAARTPRAAGPAAVPTAPSERRLVAHLHLALGREARLWRGGHPQVELRGALQEVVLQLGRLRDFFPLSHTTSNLALTTCRRLLASATIRESLLHIVTIACLRLAAKVNEKRSFLIPRIKDFIKYCGSDYTPREVLRMELAILDKLHWDLCIGTPLDFLNIEKYGVFCSNIKNHNLQFHALVVVGWPRVAELLPQRNPSLHVASLTKQLQHCMAGHQLLQFKGSTLALVIITLELERLMPDWCAPISDLLKKAQDGQSRAECIVRLMTVLLGLESSSCTDNFFFHLR
uniref:Cyclin I family member 2 n=1 Tax=Myotis lucifugus TaxID=59463 RepID=G1QB52_MYOLU